ncbi:TRAP transporter substrate-binding protein [Paralimibaculum aggregatum]|uniref:TRAP transporter substrate-binding protein n=1 Tax=Paralimibaculum aggregatum TaxID=3036245 RepID=A0ABQ6LTM3_9RHOB|nr:TRAP transporter substrate-binding protein DctP [Limibaculum sp. NKW23]GMG85434.1 TRAP transporter substrate-binding protein [Limibaculum sp. NKW23]
MKMRKMLAAAGVIAIACAGAASAAERLSLSTWGSPKHYQVAEFVPLFEEKLKEKSGGEFRLRSFEGGEMVKQQFVSSAVPQGTVDISLTTLDNWSGRIADVGILTTPLWNKSMEWTLDNLRPGSPIFEYFDARLREEGAMLIALFDIGPPVVSANFQVTGPESFEGKAIRVYSKGSGEVIQTLGAAPTIMGVGDVYSALQRGTVQGALGGLGGAVGLKHYEVTDVMFVPNGVMGTLIHAYVMNLERFEKLSPELQTALMEAAGEARDHMQQFAIDKLSTLLDVVRENGNEVVVVEPGSPLWQSFAKKLEPLSEAAKSAYSPEVQALVAAD